MNNTKEDVAWLGIRFLDVLFHRLAQWGIAGLVALHNLSTLFCDYDDVIIFVYYLHYMFMPPSIWMT